MGEHSLVAGALVPEGAAAVIVDVMDRFPDDVLVQSSALHTLGELAEWGHGGRQIAHALGLTRVFGAMTRLLTEPSVQEAGCRALRGLKQGGSPMTGMVEAAVRAKARHPENEGVVAQADTL